METKDELRQMLAEAQAQAQAARQRVEVLQRQTDLSNEVRLLQDLIEQFKQIAPATPLPPASVGTGNAQGGNQ